MQAIGPKMHPKLIELAHAVSERVLALDCARLIAPEGPIPLRHVTHARFSEIGVAFLAEVAPTTVIVPLFSGQHDALAMVEALQAVGFAGTILVIAPPLPRPELVERELRAAGPGSRLMLVSP